MGIIAFFFIVGAICATVSGFLFWLNRLGGQRDTESQSQDEFNTFNPNRQFTLQELLDAPKGTYEWSEDGVVFKVQNDGSCTVVGKFNPAEMKNPVEQLREKLISGEILDMFPRLWCFLEGTTQCENGWNLYIESNHACRLYRIPVFPQRLHVLDFVDAFGAVGYDEIFKTSNVVGALKAIINSGVGTLILLPNNETEYVRSLGAKACLERIHVDGKTHLSVMISSPAVMGALGACCKLSSDHTAKVSFAYGYGDDDFTCCDMETGDGFWGVSGLSRSSIIQPLPETISSNLIKDGLMVTSFMRAGQIVDCLLSDALPYYLSLAIVSNGQMIETVCLSESERTIPFMTDYVKIQLQSNQTLAFLIGKTIVSDNLLEDGGIVASPKRFRTISTNLSMSADRGLGTPSLLWVKVECDASQEIRLMVKTPDGQEYDIVVGELIG